MMTNILVLLSLKNDMGNYLGLHTTLRPQFSKAPAGSSTCQAPSLFHMIISRSRKW